MRSAAVLYSETVRIRVLFFGMLKDIVGRTEDCPDLPAPLRLDGVFEHYAAQCPRLRELASSIVLAHNQEFAPATTDVAEGDEVASLPPVSGGSGPYTHVIQDPGGHFFALTREPIDIKEVAARILHSSDGAIVHFEGVVRNNSKGRQTRFLDYECYEAMAIRMMASIGREVAAAHDVGLVAMVHRLGRMEIGETSVVVTVCSPHRRAAFDAALEGINRLKKLVPVWKKEYFADGEVWVEGEWDDSVIQR